MGMIWKVYIWIFCNRELSVFSNTCSCSLCNINEGNAVLYVFLYLFGDRFNLRVLLVARLVAEDEPEDVDDVARRIEARALLSRWMFARAVTEAIISFSCSTVK